MKQIFSNLYFLFSELRHHDPAMLFFEFITAILSVAFPLLSTFFSAELIRIVTENVTMMEFFSVIVFFSAIVMFIKLCQIVIRGQLNARGFTLQMRFRLLCLEKQMKISYVSLESPDGMNSVRRAFEGIGALQVILDKCREIFTSVLGFLLYGAVISTLHPLIVVVMLVTTVVHYKCMELIAKLDFNDKKESIPLDRKIDYIIAKCRDFTFAKEIRMLVLKSKLVNRCGELLSQRLEIFRRQQGRHFRVQVLLGLLSFVQTALIYVYLIAQTIRGDINASEFILYLGTITGFSGWIIQIIEHYGVLIKNNLDLTDLRCFLKSEDNVGLTECVCSNGAPEIQIKNLGFSYNSEKTVLSGLDLNIHAGEKIALVGLNGAGKTTLVKLLCGLYTPVEGEILVNGKDKISFADFSVVFQDIYLLPVTIAENIALRTDIDPKKMQKVLKMSGMDEVIAKLPEKENTLLVKEINGNAVELSGGERQKLAIARALYKDGSIMILDEPTAALDPISEDNVYRKFSEMTTGKTTVFISHRLASTRFCDRILLLQGGKIIECGTHDQLMKLGGEYAHLFDVQSKYYQSKESEIQ